MPPRVFVCLLLFFCAATAWLPAQENPANPVAAAPDRNALQRDLDAVEARLRVTAALLDIIGARLPATSDPELAAARVTLAAAQAQADQAAGTAELAALEARVRDTEAAVAAQQESVLAKVPGYPALRARFDHLEAALADLERVEPLKNAQREELVELRRAREDLDRTLQRTRRCYRYHRAVAEAARLADAAVTARDAAREKSAALKAATRARDAARKALAALERERAAASAAGAALVTERAALETRKATLRAALTASEQAQIGSARWQHSVAVPMPDRKGKPQPARKAELWIPPGCRQVRGIILCDTIVIAGKLAQTPAIRIAAAENDLAVILSGFDAIFDYKQDNGPERLAGLLTELAAKAGHPELPHAPLLTVGHSTSGIFARNVARWQPDRVIGILHIKSGNFHHHIPVPGAGFAGVPMLAINGEYEEYGPEGGLRPEYWKQTQWIMARDQILRLRRGNPEYLIALAVDPFGTHTSWSDELTDLCALFIRATAQRRLPPPPSDPATPVRCRPLAAAEGWLVDADIKAPAHPAGPYAGYPGRKTEAFWVPDGDFAAALNRLHSQLAIPDPSRESPVPDDWPGARL